MTEAPSGTTARNHGRPCRVMLAAASAFTIAIALMLGSAGGSYALWTSSASINAGVVTSGSISASLTVTPELAIPLTTGLPARTAVITIANGGTVAADYATRASLTGDSAADLASAIAVEVWAASSAASCAAPSSPGTGYFGTWSTASSLDGAMDGRLGAGASAVYCVRTTLTTTSGVVSGGAVQVSLATSLTTGNWLSSATAAFTQTFIDDVAPSVPTGLSATGISATSATISWSAATDNVAVSGYELYRGTALIATLSQQSLSFTDSNLTPGTGYSYTVTARDAAGHVSPRSVALSVSTAAAPPVDSTLWYQIKTDATQCLQANTSAGKWQKRQCANIPSQTWQFQGPDADGYYSVVPGALGDGTQQLKILEGPAGTYLLQSVDGNCLVHRTSANIESVQCDVSSALQAFTFTPMPTNAMSVAMLPAVADAEPSLVEPDQAGAGTSPLPELVEPLPPAPPLEPAPLEPAPLEPAQLESASLEPALVLPAVPECAGEKDEATATPTAAPAADPTVSESPTLCQPAPA